MVAMGAMFGQQSEGGESKAGDYFLSIFMFFCCVFLRSSFYVYLYNR